LGIRCKRIIFFKNEKEENPRGFQHESKRAMPKKHTTAHKRQNI
jgi:hypothetical protein